MSSTDNKEKLKILFKKQVLTFLDELITSYSHVTMFVIIRIFVKDQIPLNDVLGRFIKICVPYKDVITKRDDNFMIESDALIKSFGATEWAMETKKILVDFWLSDSLDEDSRDMIWKWINLLITIAEKYKNNHGYVEGWEP